ncbi:MAG: alkaline phosphatase [Acidobacteriia bacterium]|nr:alkaline phosphatase [Terriglobia bacterium]
MRRRGTIEAVAWIAVAAGTVWAREPAASPSAFLYEPPDCRPTSARNVIFMVPDGMGLADVTAARIFKNGPGGDPLNLEKLQFVGYERNWSANSAVTDSAAAASAWACGEKFDNGVLCVRHDGSTPLSLLEFARDRGKRTGLVATSTITHATPAAFGAHVRWRDCETEIARQYVEKTRPDVILGGGTTTFRPSWPDACGTGGDYVAKAVAAGYRFVTTSAELSVAVTSGASRILGLFAPGAMTPENQRPAGSTEPRLKEMAAAALATLERAPGGFFLLVEGSQIDFANHANDEAWQLAELLAFDETVGMVLDWLAADARRGGETLVIVAPDHETGGYGFDGPYGFLPGPGQPVESIWATGGHTGTDVPVWSQGPGAWRLARPIDNTEVYGAARDAMSRPVCWLGPPE